MTSELHPAAAAVRDKLPAQVCHATVESGAGIDLRILAEHDVDAMSGRIAAAVLRWAAAMVGNGDWRITSAWLYDQADEINEGRSS